MEADGYWILRDDGTIRTFGHAPVVEDVSGAPTAPAIAFAPAHGGVGAWVLDASGAVHACGAAEPVDTGDRASPAVALAATRAGDGLWIAHADGTVTPHGSAERLEPSRSQDITARVAAITTCPVGEGYWLLDEAGDVWGFGDAEWHGAVPKTQRGGRAVGLASLPDASGYWIARQDTAVFCLGGAPYLGVMSGVARVQAVGVQANRSGTGFWIIGRRGEVVPFGQAMYRGESHDPPYAIAMQAFPPPDADIRRRQEKVRVAVRDAIGAHWRQGATREPAASELSLRLSDRPQVSIVVPVYGHDDLTLRCLAAIEATVPDSIPYEVIVIDDGSPADTGAMLAKIRGIRVITNDANVGYLRSCNTGAAAARAPFLVLLNNDTEPQSGWLEALLDAAARSPEIGVVGAKLLDGDGLISEAGAIIWRDGEGWNVGRGAPKDLSEYAWVRDVDYASAACLLVRRDLWARVGGFDERFGPAYYEDVDLAFSARELGYRVVYQPLAEVVHLEGSTHGSDDAAGGKQHQVANRGKFVDKWRTRLQEQREHDTGNVLLAACRRRRPIVLFVDSAIPTPDQDAGSGRALEVLRALQRIGCTVVFVAEDGDLSSATTRTMQQMGIEVAIGAADLHHLLAALGRELDLCILSHPGVAARFLPQVRMLAPDARVAFDTVDLHFVREQRRADVTGSTAAQRSADSYRAIEVALTQVSDLVLTATDADAWALEDMVACATAVIPTVHPPQPPGPPYEARRGLLFVGSFRHLPNVDAVQWFVTDVMPLLRAEIPDLTFAVVGSHVPDEISELAGDGVEVVGWVPDLTPVYASTRLSVAPLRYGSGIKGKIAESMSFGVPTITTTIGVEGTGFEPDREILVADDAASYAAAVVRAYTDPDLWSALSTQGRRVVEDRFSPTAVERRLRELFRGLEIALPPTDG